MTIENLNRLSATDIAKGIKSGAFSAEAVMRAHLARIEEREAAVHAWAWLDPDLALSQAKASDNAGGAGILRGVPVGIKDIMDTFDMPTAMGSPIHEGYRPAVDASCVALMRAAGAIIMGKTVTAEFAGTHPGETANPHNAAHTPGGSSSGSAAGVADFMVPVAFGTQTGGSVLRPSSYCGIIGYKPTYGSINRAGIKFAAEGLDTIGLHARTLDDIELLMRALTNRPAGWAGSMEKPPRIGLCRTFLWQTAQPETVEAVEDAAGRLAEAGCTVRDAPMPDDFERLAAARDIFNNFERARGMAHEWAHDRDRLSDELTKSIATGLEIPHADYAAAIADAQDCRAKLPALFSDFDVLLAPCVAGEAPEGLHNTGDPRFQGLWTILHVPTLTLPTHKGPKGLPVGIQLVAPFGRDDKLIAAARWIETALQS
jgi:amidase